jgi:hypothetical protein
LFLHGSIGKSGLSIPFHHRVRDVVERDPHRGGPQCLVRPTEVDSISATTLVESVDRGIQPVARPDIFE